MISVSLEVVPDLLPSRRFFFPRPRGLDHLVNGAVAFGEKFVGEPERDVVNDLGLLKGEERAVITARREEAFCCRGTMGLMGTVFLAPTIPILLIFLASHTAPNFGRIQSCKQGLTSLARFSPEFRL